MDRFFKNRLHAASALTMRLQDLSNRRLLVLGIPRGGALMAKTIADTLGARLDLMLVKKIPHPEDPEMAVGAVSENGDVIIGTVASQWSLSEKYLDDQAHSLVRTLRSQRGYYTPGRGPLSLTGETVILVDDGVATGATMVTAVRSAKALGAGSVVVATPMIGSSAFRLLESEGAEVRSLIISDRLDYIGDYYEDFHEVSDADIRALFEHHRPLPKDLI